MSKGYKQMLRDRMPLMLNLALTYCKAKNKWIDHVYSYIISKYPKEKRSTAVKIVLGIKQQYKRQEIYDYFRYVKLMDVNKNQMLNIPKNDLFMRFKDTIDWKSLSMPMYGYWVVINEWVEWFRKNHIRIQSSYEHSISFGNDEETTKSLLMSKYNLDRDLVNYLIKSFK